MGLFLSVCLSLYSVDSFWALICCCFVNYCLLYWFCWLVSLIRLTAFLLFLSLFPGLGTVCRCQLRLSPHTPKSAQICLRWLNRRKTAPVAFPARTTMPSGKLWTPSEFPEGCSAHLELRRPYPASPIGEERLPLKLEKNLWKSVASVWLCELRII